KTGFRPDQIIIHGESLGTAVAVDLAARRPCAAVILEAPFTSAKDVAQTIAPVIGPMLIWGFDSRAKIGGIHAPIFFIHGDRDKVIPLRLGQDLFAAAHQPKSFWLVPGAGHNDIAETAGASYRQHLQSPYARLRTL
ncbi:MAG: alpha/beta hydrolase, partial [Bryobacteraceae bacterium]